MFWRKTFNALLEWKEKYSDKYAVMLEGARRVGKSTIAEEFAKTNFKTYIKIDFANIDSELLAVFKDIANLDLFFLRLQTITGVALYPHESVIIFDEIQRQPLVRQAIKYLVADGRYKYIETGSLISIRQNVKNIVIPSEEYFIQVYPMDYEEFLLATGKSTYNLLRELYKSKKPVGNEVNRKLMRDFRIYMAVGGMPQSVDAYVNGSNFEEIDKVKRGILKLYEEDFYKIDKSGRLSKMYNAIPTQLALNKKRYVISSATGKRTTEKDKEIFSELIDSKTVLVSYNTTDPSISLSATATDDSYKMYLADTGLFTTQLFNSADKLHTKIYAKLLSDKLDANLGYLYENVAAQIIAASGNKLFYHTWKKNDDVHDYEVDFILASNAKLVPVEVKSSAVNTHKSITEFCSKYSSKIYRQYLLSQKDVDHNGQLLYKPLYMLPFLLEEM
ncbi:MAG: ATP-binding protein [Treponema sp.]|uniref:ATP-binding protein n=1 Tax=Treponema sp. TaxID=166 RepID=UPI0025D04003|nr:AAA family ATPase [Treponema sp.]MBQ8678758.1 ATP-binding protein [Treponema sp.]MBQ8681250.1 ATP-binding protein [Treponema sp.]